MWVNRLTVLAGLGCLLGSNAGDCAAQENGTLQPLASVRATAEKAVRGVLEPFTSGDGPEAHGRVTRFATAPRRLRCAARSARTAAARQPVTRARAGFVFEWRARGPVHVPVDIRRTHKVLVLRRAFARGETIGAGDVESQTRELPGMASPFVARIEELAGRLTKRPIPAGSC